MIITQETNQVADPDLTRSLKNSIHRENRQRQGQQAKDIHAQLTPQLKRCVDLAAEKGSSSWLTALPLSDHGFYLHKGEFREAVCLRYDWELKNTPQTCSCGAAFTMHRPRHDVLHRRLSYIRHDEVCNITATLLT